MAAAKNKQSAPSAAASVRRLFSWIFGSGRTALFLLLLAGLFVGGAIWAWAKFKDRILAGPEYRIAAEQVEITPQPPWIQSDIRAEVLHSPALDGPLSILDDDIVDRITNAFARHPWVAKVGRVSKQYGAVKVELAYRKPVCMIELRGG